MTYAQMRAALQIELDKQAGYASAAFIDTELNYFLDTAYRELVDRKCNKYMANEIAGIVDPIVEAEIQPLIAMWAISITTGIHSMPNATLRVLHFTMTGGFNDKSIGSGTPYKWIAPTKLDPASKHVIGVEYAKHETDSGARTVYKLIPITHAQAIKFLTTTRNIPYIPHPVYTIDTKPIHLDYDYTHVLNVYSDGKMFAGGTSGDLLWLRVCCYQKVNSDADLILVTWADEIIRHAATLALENIESERASMHNQLTQQMA